MKDIGNEPNWSKLWTIESKVKAISFLIESQDTQCPMPLPWDMQDVQCGLGKILWDLGDNLASIRREIESAEFKKRKPAKKNKAAKRKKPNKRGKA